jgi:hypothetical protein
MVLVAIGSPPCTYMYMARIPGLRFNPPAASPAPLIDVTLIAPTPRDEEVVRAVAGTARPGGPGALPTREPSTLTIRPLHAPPGPDRIVEPGQRNPGTDSANAKAEKAAGRSVRLPGRAPLSAMDVTSFAPNERPTR